MTTTWTPFADAQPANVCGGVGGEPSALLSDDGLHIDLWHSTADGIVYGSSTDGLTFGSFQSTGIASSYLRAHVLKDQGTYYLYASGAGDTTIHLFSGPNTVRLVDQGEVLAPGSAGAWDSSHVANTFVWREGSTWSMLYEATKTGDTRGWSIGLATAAAPQGPWTRYAGNPVIAGNGAGGGLLGAGNPELVRWGSSVTTYGGRYYCYFHGTAAGCAGPINRAYSTDLHTWTIEGAIDGIWHSHLPLWDGASGWTYGDQCLVPAPGGGTYLYFSPSNQVDASYLDGAFDHRSPLQMVAAPAAGAAVWQTGCVPPPL